MAYGFAIKVTGGPARLGWLRKHRHINGARGGYVATNDVEQAAYHMTEGRGRNWLAELADKHPAITFQLWALEDMRLIETRGPKNADH